VTKNEETWKAYKAVTVILLRNYIYPTYHEIFDYLIAAYVEPTCGAELMPREMRSPVEARIFWYLINGARPCQEHLEN
jgi:hypothetical protein